MRTGPTWTPELKAQYEADPNMIPGRWEDEAPAGPGSRNRRGEQAAQRLAKRIARHWLTLAVDLANADDIDLDPSAPISDEQAGFIHRLREVEGDYIESEPRVKSLASLADLQTGTRRLLDEGEYALAIKTLGRHLSDRKIGIGAIDQASQASVAFRLAVFVHALRLPRRCGWCRRALIPVRHDQKWCSKACCVTAWQAAQSDEWKRAKWRTAKRAYRLKHREV